MERVNSSHIYQLLDARKWSVSKLAREADLGYATVFRTINGTTLDPSLRTLNAIAHALNVRVADILTKEEERVTDAQFMKA